MAEEKRKRILSGIQPTGTPTLGNYIGAVRNWALLQSDYDCLYMVADLHSLTVRQVPADLRRRTRELAALLLAVGIDPKEHVLFVQSHVPAHTELAWVLACNTQFGELSRMTQFKDKSAKHPDNVNGGLFTYPVLMAADILIYNADLVPVGQDQTQHLEIARDIAGRFNGIYGDTFTLPEGYVPAAGAKIMSLAEPTKKMSKSDTNINSFILMTDDKDAIVRKFKRAVTDSDGVVRFDRETKPGVSNLMCIYSTFTGKSNDEIAAEFEGKVTSNWPWPRSPPTRWPPCRLSMPAFWPTRPTWTRSSRAVRSVPPAWPAALSARSTARLAFCSWINDAVP